MVVFTCNHCGESVHKPKVEKHYQFQCKTPKSVTCVDCFKDFRDEEYVAHIKCLTEDERYAAKGTYKNGIIKKGEVKQESWVEMIRSICNAEVNLKPSLRTLLETISTYSNVPRKKAKFMNFIKNSSGNRINIQEVEQVWDIIEKYKTKNASTKQNGNKDSLSETPDNSMEKKAKKRPNENTECPKKKKNKLEDLETDIKLPEKDAGTMNKKIKKRKPNTEAVPEISETTPVNVEESKFNYKAKILEILIKKQSISYKKLEKKILKEYIKATGQSECEEKVIKKFKKKLRKIPNVVIEDDKVLFKV